MGKIGSKEGEVIEIEWFDVTSVDTALVTGEEILAEAKLSKAKVIGYYVGETAELLILAKEMWNTKPIMFKYLHFIPKYLIAGLCGLHYPNPDCNYKFIKEKLTKKTKGGNRHSSQA